jgi:hypothetical protein
MVASEGRRRRSSARQMRRTALVIVLLLSRRPRSSNSIASNPIAIHIKLSRIQFGPLFSRRRHPKSPPKVSRRPGRPVPMPVAGSEQRICVLGCATESQAIAIALGKLVLRRGAHPLQSNSQSSKSLGGVKKTKQPEQAGPREAPNAR